MFHKSNESAVVIVLCLCSAAWSQHLGGACTCGADVVGGGLSCGPDESVDANDMFYLLNCFNGSNPCGANCDVDCDGDVDLVDVSYPLCQFMGVCTGCDGMVVGACCFGGLSGNASCSQASQFQCIHAPINGTYFGDGTTCTPSPCDCNGNLTPDGQDIAKQTSNDGDGDGIPDECQGFACCGPNPGQCANLSDADCMSIGGVWLGETFTKCPAQNVAFIQEPGGGIFVHRIGPPVECPLPGGQATSPAEGPCPPGQFIDAWVSPANGAMCHTFGVSGSPAIPANFFGSGSDPFSGSVCLEGVPLGPTSYGTFGEADTLIRRTSDPFDRCALPSPTEVTIPIVVVELSLVSVSPITVTYNAGQNPEQWNVAVDLSSVTPPPSSLTATKTHCNGGTYTSILNVQPRFMFTKVTNPIDVQVLDTGVAGIPPVTLNQINPAPWVQEVDPPYNANIDPCSAFHAGFGEAAISTTGCDCNANTVHDSCDILDCPGGDSSCQDCNNNARPDGCDISSGASQDLDQNGVPDECDVGPTIPTVATWGVVGVTLGLLVAGTVVFRRRLAMA